MREFILFKGAAKNHPSSIKLALWLGANIEAQNVVNNTALIIAAKNGNAECIKLLLDKGANI